MTIAFSVSLFFNVLLCAFGGYSLYLLNRAGAQINQYEVFYQETIDALEKHLTYMQNLMNVNIGISGDESVRKVFKTIKTFYEMLVNYANAGRSD